MDFHIIKITSLNHIVALADMFLCTYTTYFESFHKKLCKNSQLHSFSSRVTGCRKYWEMVEDSVDNLIYRYTSDESLRVWDSLKEFGPIKHAFSLVLFLALRVRLTGTRGNAWPEWEYWRSESQLWNPLHCSLNRQINFPINKGGAQ